MTDELGGGGWGLGGGCQTVAENWKEWLGVGGGWLDEQHSPSLDF